MTIRIAINVTEIKVISDDEDGMWMELRFLPLSNCELVDAGLLMLLFWKLSVRGEAALLFELAPNQTFAAILASVIEYPSG